ncbi:BUB protein kinase [Kwoniella mangroviensis CBS 10435]|uniref:BUB protein kinase n=1 Tax=Kwoniella mangroviensis CBS 10435 TaxID=1331196 RepID=A0A1B9J149_9TREE|nr:BUB protein kinase [Kwoniella mangroviensis CBS 10435]
MESLFSPGQRPPSPSSSGPVTDFALIESQKENIRPLATGRSAATLSNVFKEPTAADKVVQEGHERFRKDIEDAEKRDKEGEDMIDKILDILDVYNKYILFVAQHHVSSDTHLLPLLETTTRRFVNDTRYTQDIRYLKLWVMYARQIERREEIWAFLESRDIGTRHSVFYEEWASALEGLGRRKKADEIYRLGIARKASPPDRLKNRHKQFLERIMAPPSGVVPDDEPSSSTSAPARTLGRSVLGQVATASASVAGATQLAPSLRVASKGNGSKMEVFSDDNGRSEDTAPGEWADFGTRDARRKENTIEATPWKGETLPQSASRLRMAPRTPKVEVFKDVSENEGIRSADEVFVRQKQPPTEAELLKSDPLRHYDTSELSTALPSLPAPPSARKPPKPAKASSSSRFVMQAWECPRDGPDTRNAAGKVERRMFDWNAVYKNGDEWSFEEIRARQRGLLGREWKGEVKEWERSWHNPGSSTPKAEEKKVKPPSPTVNTKLAELEVMKMFDQTIHGGTVRNSASDSDDSSDEEEEEEPVQCAPTPLPARPGSIAMLAATPGAMIPPTPTPAGQSRLFTPGENPTSKPLVFNDENAASSKPTVFQDENIQSSNPAVFSDENSVPPSASKSGKFNIFNDTPAKTPLTSRTSLASSSSKPKAFGIFSDENGDQENAVQATPSIAPKERQPLSQNLFATPALTRQSSYGRGVTESIQGVPEGDEEDGEAEEEEAGFVHEVQQGVSRVDLNDVYEEEEEEERPRGMRRFQINTMTPITERTCEYTHMTNLRSSTASNTRPFSVAEDEDEGQEDAFVASDPAKVTAGVSSSNSENQLPPQQAGDESTSPPAQCIEYDKSILSEDDMPSGDINGKFQLPEGFTIHRNENTMHTMVLTDGETMHTAREGSVDPTTESENFVTANHQIPEIFNIPNPCNPASPEILETILTSIEPPIPQIPGFIDCRSTSSSNWAQLQKHAKSRGSRGSTNSRASVAPSDDIAHIELQGKKYEFGDKVGEGGFGLVFSAVDVAQRQLEDDMDSDDEEEDEDGDEKEDKSILAIKVEQPSSIWEYIVLNRIYSRISQSAVSSIIQTRQLYAFKDESYLLMDYSSQGTLLDVVNKANTIGVSPSTSGGPSTLEEMLCIFFVVELLKLIEELHSNDFIHGDLKIDNCLIRLPDIPNSPWSASYSKKGENGWSSKGVRLIDFGKTLDLTLYPAKRKQKFVIGGWKADEKDCIEMQNGENWSYQTDYYGLASIAYTMLYGKYIKVVKGQDGLWAIDQGLKRYWQQDLWTNFFRTLLNPGDDLPIIDSLVEMRRGFENWLEENCQKGGKNLKSMLKKIELAAITGKR